MCQLMQRQMFVRFSCEWWQLLPGALCWQIWGYWPAVKTVDYAAEVLQGRKGLASDFWAVLIILCVHGSAGEHAVSQHTLNTTAAEEDQQLLIQAGHSEDPHNAEMLLNLLQLLNGTGVSFQVCLHVQSHETEAVKH